MERNKITQVLNHFRIYIAVGIILVVLNILFYILVIKYQNSTVEALRNDYVNVRSSLKEKKITETELQLIRADKDLSSFKNSLPDVEALVDRVREIYSLINKNRLNVDKVIFKPEKDERIPFQKYVTSFSVTGKYKNIKMLLSGIQNLQPLFCIEDIQFLNKSDEVESVSMKLSISTYFKIKATKQ